MGLISPLPALRGPVTFLLLSLQSLIHVISLLPLLVSSHRFFPFKTSLGPISLSPSQPPIQILLDINGNEFIICLSPGTSQCRKRMQTSRDTQRRLCPHRPDTPPFGFSNLCKPKRPPGQLREIQVPRPPPIESDAVSASELNSRNLLG